MISELKKRLDLIDPNFDKIADGTLFDNDLLVEFAMANKEMIEATFSELTAINNELKTCQEEDGLIELADRVFEMVETMKEFSNKLTVQVEKDREV